MFCYQCEQVANGTGCKIKGVCGKDPDVAVLIDLLIYATKGISMYANKARELGAKDHEIDIFTIKALFSTVTNVNFDPERHYQLLKKAEKIQNKAKKLYKDACKKSGKSLEQLAGPAEWKQSDDLEGMIKQGEEVSISKRKESLGDDITGLQELIMYGLMGMAAYADHAQILGQEDAEVYAFFHKTLSYLADEPTDINGLLATALECGKVNLRIMELLDLANTNAYGHPEPTYVRVEPIKGKAIVVSGHDLKDLEELLKQTEGKGINIYTHGEMLPAHGYPELKKYKHLVGNYGGAWQDQRNEFEDFPGAILMTTNCIQRPKDSYKGRIFTSGLVAWPDVTHIDNSDFTPVIESALKAEGFIEDGADKKILVGFGHNAVMSVADKVIEAVKSGAIKRFYLIGGCDGAKPGRNYYTKMAESIPKDSVILTLACGKYRFNKLDFGTVAGIPRLLDIGQCNDSYSAIQIAVALAKAFDTDVNSLPLSFILSWYEQKACCILLTLLHLGIKNMYIGPSLPAFISPSVLNVLVEKFNLTPISSADSDLSAILS
ncbi:MAG: hydroxylamine reductase [Candidatus Poribacteria bacterium]